MIYDIFEIVHIMLIPKIDYYDNSECLLNLKKMQKLYLDLTNLIPDDIANKIVNEENPYLKIKEAYFRVKSYRQFKDE